MKKPIYPCLWFDGQAKDAATFYCSIFKNSKIVADTPMVTTFDLNGIHFMGLNGGPNFKFTPSVSFFVQCGSEKEIQQLWDQLSNGGKTLMALDKYPWSDRYGWIEDQFGLTWQLMKTDREEVSQQIYPSLLFTGEQFGKAEEAVKYYTSIFPDSETGMMNFYEAGDASILGKLTYGECTIGKTKFSAMDGPGEHHFNFNEAVSFVVECDTQKEIDTYWDELTLEGTESQCGWLKDKFGVSWQIIPGILSELMTDKERAPRVMQAVLKMKKFDIEILLNA